MSDTTEKAKTPAGADPLDFEDEANIRRFVRPNRWVSLDIAGIPVRARARERDFGFFCRSRRFRRSRRVASTRDVAAGEGIVSRANSEFQTGRQPAVSVVGLTVYSYGGNTSDARDERRSKIVSTTRRGGGLTEVSRDRSILILEHRCCASTGSPPRSRPPPSGAS